MKKIISITAFVLSGMAFANTVVNVSHGISGVTYNSPAIQECVAPSYSIYTSTENGTKYSAYETATIFYLTNSGHFISYPYHYTIKPKSGSSTYGAGLSLCSQGSGYHVINVVDSVTGHNGTCSISYSNFDQPHFYHVSLGSDGKCAPVNT